MSNLNPYRSTNKRGNTGLGHNSFNVRRDYHQPEVNNTDYHILDDFDNNESWKMREIDMLEGMGFKIEGDSHMGLTVPGDLENNKYTVSKHKKYGPELKINDRKHYFRTFDHMMEKIDEFGTLDI
jgi:hypothetical protein